MHISHDPSFETEFAAAPEAGGEGEGTPPCTALGGAVHGTPPDKPLTEWSEEDWNQFDASREAAKHRVSVRIGDKSYPAQVSEALHAMPDWRGTPEYERLVASATRDRKFQQAVLGKLIITGSKAMPIQIFEIEDGRHRYYAAQESCLDFIDGKLTEMPVAELMLRSLLERRHLEKGARAYLAWPVIEPFVSANKEARAARGKSNLKRGKEKGEAPRNPANGISGDDTLSDIAESELPEADAVRFKTLADSYGIGHTLLDQARRVHEIFVRRKDLKVENEPMILAGELGLGACIAGIAGKDATEGKKRQDADPLTLLKRGFKDLTVRFAKWDTIPEDLRRNAANEAVDHVLVAWPPDVREKLKIALA